MAAVTVEDKIHDLHDDHGHDDDHGPALSWPEQLKANRLGLWLFCISELFLFAALLAARFYLWRDADGVFRPELSQSVGLITTTMLLVSSYFMVRAEVAAEYEDGKQMERYLWVTFILGLVFLLGVVIVEWGTIPSVARAITGHHDLLKPTDGTLGAVFFFMTGFHALHVLTGLIYILTCIYNGRKGKYSKENHWGVESCALYWHYVDVIWIFFYPALYLVGHVYHP